MKTSCLAFLVTIIPSFLVADNLITKDRTYRDVQVISNRSDCFSITIRHNSGTAKISYSEMSEADKVKYGYNPSEVAKVEAEKQRLAELKKEKAQAKEEETRRENIRKAKEAEENKKLERQKYIKLIDGVAYDFSAPLKDLETAQAMARELIPQLDNIRNDAEHKQVLKRFKEEQELMRPHSWLLLSGKVMQVLDDGVLVNCDDISPFNGYNGIVFVTGWEDQSRAVDGDSIGIVGMPRGRYSYESTMGAKRTVTKFVRIQKLTNEVPDSEIRMLP